MEITFRKFVLIKFVLIKEQPSLGGAVDKNLPADAGDTGSTPGSGRSYIPWNNFALAPQLSHLRSRAHEPPLLKPTCPRACALQ